jgi:hypothetical protein
MAIKFSNDILVDAHKLCKNIDRLFDMEDHDIRMDVENYTGKIPDMDVDVPDIDTSDFGDSE